MQRFCEFSLRVPVARWLISRGLAPVCEVDSLHNCDLVGIRWDRPGHITEMVAVELKLTDIAGVLRQCACHINRQVTETWAAMPAVSAKSQLKFANLGVGLLIVEGDRVVEMVAPQRFESTDLRRWANLYRRRDEHKWRMKHPLMFRFEAQRLLAQEIQQQITPALQEK